MPEYGWFVEDRGIPAGLDDEDRGSRYLIGNGLLGMRGSLDEHGRHHKAGLMVNGLYDRSGDAWREPVNVPNPFFAAVLDEDGRPLVAGSSSTDSHRHGIEFSGGVHYRETRFSVPSMCGTLRIRSRRFVSQERRGLLCQQYRIDAEHPANLVLRMGVDTDLWEINGPHFRKIVVRNEREARIAEGTTAELGVPVRVVVMTRFPGMAAVPPAEPSDEPGLSDYPVVVGPGDGITIERFALVLRGGEEDFDRWESVLTKTADDGYPHAERRQQQAWRCLWNAADVRIEGDEEADRALRFSLYHLLSALPPGGESVSVPARGLSGPMYKGAVFWDTEMFMLPFYRNALPERAAGLLRYRIAALDGARRKAREYGFLGAFYAWESQEHGIDACTLFNITDVLTGRPLRTFFRDGQIHISADIACAIFDTARRTGDDALLLEGGAEVIYECALFYWSRSCRRPFRDRWEIEDVTGPDEYHEQVNNNFFTNRVVRECLDACLEIDAWLAERHPDVRAAVAARPGFLPSVPSTADLDGFMGELRRFRDGLYVPEPREGDGVIPQFDGYFDLEDPSLDELRNRRKHPDEYLGGPAGVARWTQILKQADVVLALSRCPDSYSREIIGANWDYYEPRTDHGSSLSATAYSIVAARLGRTESAYRYFMDTATIDLRGGGKRYVGDLYIGGIHPAAQGGAWMAVVEGFCGLTIGKGAITAAPRFPDSWTAVSLPLSGNGWRADVRIEADGWIVDTGSAVHRLAPGETWHPGAPEGGRTEEEAPV